MSKNTKVDVFISGAGPVGLFFAYQMASRGHSVCIVDPKGGPTSQSRAILVTSRTMEILQNKGFGADILYESFIGGGMKMFSNGKVIAQLNANIDTSFAHLSCLMQAFTEKTFLNRINEETDLKVDWNTKLVSYIQNDNSVTCIIQNVDTKEERIIQSSYIVGADGTHSTVRKGNSDWTYKGVAIQTRFALADLVLKGKDVDENMMDKMNYFVNGTGAMGIVRINPVHPTNDGAHVFRVFGNVDQYSCGVSDEENPSHGVSDRKKEQPPSLEFIKAWIKEKADPFEMEFGKELIWSTYFRINERMANGFRRKRAFLIGDSAHCHSPAGGQGMNLGLQDADNLAWKMSDVLKGLSSHPEALLDSYSFERESIVRATINMTSNTTKIGLGGSKVFGYLRNYLISVALMVPVIRQSAFRNLMQLWVTIDPTSKVLGTSPKCLIQPGQFLPESSALRKSTIIHLTSSKQKRRIERNTIHELLIGNQKYIAIFVGTCFSESKPNNHLIKKFWNDTKSLPIRRVIIRSSWHSHQTKFFPDYILKEEEAIAEESFFSEERMENAISMTSRVGLLPLLTSYFASDKPPSVLLFVRPDLYVADAKLVSSEQDVENAVTFISSQYHHVLQRC